MTRENSKRTNLGDISESRNHWGKGFIIKGKRVFHPYTHKDFVNPLKQQK